MKKAIRIALTTAVMLVLLFYSGSCAKRGMPTGGPKDSIPPAFINAIPYNFSTNFSANRIQIKFDEYIKLDNPRRQVIISPPIVPEPEIRPVGTASKQITVVIADSLSENTTYTINFGNSIVDNTENNPLPFFKYVFSTGDELDSLSLSGSVSDAIQYEMKKNATVMLYKMDSTYTDSTIYQQKPTYLGYTKDTLHTFNLENMHQGKYQVIALIDKNNNYTFEPKTDKIGYLKKPVRLPNDSTFNLRVFKEILEFKMKRPKQVTQKHFIFGYQGKLDRPKINLINPPKNYRDAFYRDRKTDTLHYYYEPFIQADSLLYEVTQKNYRDTLEIVPRDIEKDSMVVSAINKGAISFYDNFKLTSNTPITSFDRSKVEIRDRDSSVVDYKAKVDSLFNEIVFKFKMDEKQNYSVQALPGALTDFYGEQNDTLNFALSTPSYSNKSNWTLTLTNVDRFPILLQLVDGEGNLKYEKQHTAQQGGQFEFRYIDPGSYFLRVIYDDNNNGKWDTGNFLKKIQPEEVRYISKNFDFRKNFDYVDEFRL